MMQSDQETNDVYEYLRQRFNTQSVFRRSSHRYRTGVPGGSYSDFDLLLNDPINCKYVTIAYAKELEKICKEHPVDQLGFIEKADGGSVGALRLAAALSAYTGIPNFTIRLGRELEFEQVKIPRLEGKEFMGKPQRGQLLDAVVTIITDNMSSGGEVEKAVKAVNYNGGRVTDLLAYTMYRDWEQKIVERFNERVPPVKVHNIWYIPEDVPEERLQEIGIEAHA